MESEKRSIPVSPHQCVECGCLGAEYWSPIQHDWYHAQCYGRMKLEHRWPQEAHKYKMVGSKCVLKEEGYVKCHGCGNHASYPLAIGGKPWCGVCDKDAPVWLLPEKEKQ